MRSFGLDSRLCLPLSWVAAGRGQSHEPRVEQDLISTTLQHCAFEIVIEDHAGLPGPLFKRMHMPTQKVFHRLIEEELQIQGA